MLCVTIHHTLVHVVYIIYVYLASCLLFTFIFVELSFDFIENLLLELMYFLFE